MGNSWNLYLKPITADLVIKKNYFRIFLINAEIFDASGFIWLLNIFC